MTSTVALHSQTGRVATGLLALLLAGCGGCGAQQREIAEASADAGPTPGSVRAVYEATGPKDALATRLCQALHALPEERRATCCARRPGLVLADECAGVLSAALRGHSLVLDAAHLEACTGALANAYAGCEWVGPFGPPFPSECQGLFTGRRAAGEACRSSLECAGRLFCAGAGPTDVGRCSPPGEKGASCSTAVDALAAYTRQDLERTHPECRGLCQRHVCQEALAAGALRESSQQCEVGKRCAEGRCAGGLAEAGERCSGGDCAAGLRCLNGRCFAPLGAGAVCQSDLECRGGCLAVAGEHRCGVRCDLR